ncbi:MAG: iron-containing alcohol dehydrogenase [Clostridia bacterium]|nr:iron-containing alcohol dehydrogenase [Clostridia bacterium]
MKFGFNMPVDLNFGAGVVSGNKGKFDLGKKALIVSGKNSARISGALVDVLDALTSNGTGYIVYDGIRSNPDLESVSKGADYGRSNGVDFIVAVGGGSPIDAGKAIAALCSNDIEPIDLIGKKLNERPLPIIAVPTTAGTGSELTPYSVLTIPSMKTKKSFYSPFIFPVSAFLDPCYTYSLPYAITLDTAFDAFTHLLESYLSLRSTPLNDIIALAGIRAFAECRQPISEKLIIAETREKLMYASCLGGMAIAQTGTTMIHSMGYSLTYFRNYSHGRANAMLIGEYLRFNYDRIPGKIDMVMKILGFKDIDEAEVFFSMGLDEKPRLSDEECRTYAKLATEQANIRQNPRRVEEEDVYKIYVRLFGGAR